MEQYINEMTAQKQMPYFEKTVCYDEEMSFYFQKLHKMILKKEESFEKEKYFYLFLSIVLHRYSKNTPQMPMGNQVQAVQKVCQWIEKQYQNTITLQQLCDIAFLSKSTLLRAFTKQKGITPYRYLESIRINEAKKLL